MTDDQRMDQVRADYLKQMPAMPDMGPIRAARRSAMEVLEEANESRWRAEDERVEREKRSVELIEHLLAENRTLAERQSVLVEIQQQQGRDAIRDRRVQYAVLVVGSLGVLIGLIGLIMAAAG